MVSIIFSMFDGTLINSEDAEKFIDALEEVCKKYCGETYNMIYEEEDD
jgi:hypothetical protein